LPFHGETFREAGRPRIQEVIADIARRKSSTSPSRRRKCPANESSNKSKTLSTSKVKYYCTEGGARGDLSIRKDWQGFQNEEVYLEKKPGRITIRTDCEFKRG